MTMAKDEGVGDFQNMQMYSIMPEEWKAIGDSYIDI